MAVWDDVLTERDKLVFPKSGYGGRQASGQKPALLVVDVTYAFVGDRPEPILQSIERFRNSCGEEGWQGVYHIKELLQVARERKVPTFFTAGENRFQGSTLGRWREKNVRSLEDSQQEWANNVVEEIAPVPGEILIRKEKPSAFFGTPLVAYLLDLGVDTLLVTGCTTSGCIRATVVDGFSYNFKMVVVEECVFDRGQASHKINLFDMQAKYADIVSLEQARGYLLSQPAPAEVSV